MDTKISWEEYIKTLPDEVRVGLAEYVAAQFLEGVEKGKAEAALSERQAGRDGAVEYINTHLMWGRNEDGTLAITSEHIAEVLEAARQVK